jgi:hypothetical protein
MKSTHLAPRDDRCRSYSVSLMQTLAKDDSADMSAPRAALLKRLEEVATKDWLAMLRESAIGK